MFTCPQCSAAFTRQLHLDQHVGTARCLMNQIPRARRRRFDTGNASRALARHSPRLIAYLKSNVEECRLAAASGDIRVDIVPFARVFGCKPADVVDMRTELARGNKQPVNLLAAALICALGWTAPFAAMLHHVPVPWAASFGTSLRRGLEAAWRRDQQVFNVRIQCVSMRSLQKCDTAAQRDRKIADVLRLARLAVAAAARAIDAGSHEAFLKALAFKGAPRRGYTQKNALVLFSGFPCGQAAPYVQPAGKRKLPYGKSIPKALVQLGLGQAARYSSAEVALALQLLARVLEEKWRFGRRVARPPFEVGDIPPQLCAWSQDEYGDAPRPNKTILAGRW